MSADVIPRGLCQCGCGEKTTIAKWGAGAGGKFRGEPMRFIKGHGARSGPANPQYKGFSIHNKGYRKLTLGFGSHPKFEHILIVERALGKPLRKGVQVHHVDENKANNENGNLVACDSPAYHKLLHRRQRALDACGDANAHRCGICGGYDNQRDITVCNARWFVAYHRSCVGARRRARAAGKALRGTDGLIHGIAICAADEGER